MKTRGIIALLLITWLCFLIGIWQGYTTPIGSFSPSTPHPSPATLHISFWQIILTNTITAILILATSIITLGFSGVIILLTNGMTTGALIKGAQIAHWHSLAIFLSLFPHGIIEISSFALFLGIGAHWSYYAFRHWFFRATWPAPAVYRHTFRQLGVAMALLLLAGLVETYITPLFLSKT